jgi:Protein of unknown function (DUF1353)
MMRRCMPFVAVWFLLCTPVSAQKFQGTLELVPPGCGKQLKCIVKNEFGFIDSKGMGWQARAGLETDGASIPPWAQPFVGGQFEQEFIRAAVIHDHYCDRHVRTWRSTHRVFHEALLASGVSDAKATLMYFAVYLGGPKWVELIRGKPCQTGKSCIQQVSNQQWPASTISKTGEKANATYVFRSAQYNDPQFGQHILDAQRFIESQNGKVKLADLEARARNIKVGDFFYANTDEIILRPSVGVDR